MFAGTNCSVSRQSYVAGGPQPPLMTARGLVRARGVNPPTTIRVHRDSIANAKETAIIALRFILPRENKKTPVAGDLDQPQ